MVARRIVKKPLCCVILANLHSSLAEKDVLITYWCQCLVKQLKDKVVLKIDKKTTANRSISSNGSRRQLADYYQCCVYKKWVSASTTKIGTGSPWSQYGDWKINITPQYRPVELIIVTYCEAKKPVSSQISVIRVIYIFKHSKKNVNPKQAYNTSSGETRITWCRRHVIFISLKSCK